MISKKKPELIVKKEYHKWRIVLAVPILLLLIAGLVVGLTLVLTNQELRGSAKTPQVKPTPLGVILPPTGLEAPYIRLINHKKTSGTNEPVPVGVYLNTGGRPTMETNLVVTYDSDLLEITNKDIEVIDLYKSAKIDTTEAGKAVITLFLTPAVGHRPVITAKDTKIATLKFTTQKVGPTETEIQLDFTRGSSGKTALFSFSLNREEIKNILQNVQGVKLTITP